MRKMLVMGIAASIMLLPSLALSQQTIQWEVTLENAQRLAGQSNRLVLVTFWAPWCTHCKRMEAEVLSNPAVAAELMKNFVPVKINADHFPATAKQYGVTGLPTTVVITPQGQLVESIRGRVETADFLSRLNRAVASSKQLGEPAYAQLPGGAALPVSIGTGNQTTAQVATAQTSAPVENRPAAPYRRGPELPSGPFPHPPIAQAPVSQTPTAQVATTAQPPIAQAPATSPSLPQWAVNQPPVTQPTQNPGQSMPSRGQTAPNSWQNTPSLGQTAPNSWQNTPNLGQTAGTQAYPPSLPPQGAPGGIAPDGWTQSPATASVAPSMAPQSPPLVARQPMSPPPVDSTAKTPAANPPFGLDGCCPVTLVEQQKWVQGDPRWGLQHRGRTYLFAGPEEQQRFWKDPDRYAPVVSGNDIVLVTEKGQAVAGMREHGVFYGNRVYLFSSEATLEKFAKNPGVYANQALEALRSGAYPTQPMR